jgi:uncharacterized membrane protein YeaQ/YmgE (transglycosylase-associated protein family)
MSIIVWLIVGAIAGYAANLILGRESVGVIRTVIFGIVGAIVGGLIGGLLPGTNFNDLLSGFNLVTIITAIIGAVIVAVISSWWDQRQAGTGSNY